MTFYSMFQLSLGLFLHSESRSANLLPNSQTRRLTVCLLCGVSLSEAGLTSPYLLSQMFYMDVTSS
jgi:hypothetical protein